MAAKSRIEWTHTTWNPVTGCDKISAGCEHCYAERMSHRLKAMGVHKYRNGFKLTLHLQVLEDPLKWKKPRLIFVNSMSDMFHEKIPLDFIKQVFDIAHRCPQHVFQILTKRSRRLAKLHHKIDWPENVWMGVTVEDGPYLYRIDDLRKTGAAVKWLSLEPLIGPLPNIDLTNIDWAVVGGESGPGARPIDEAWVLDIQRHCTRQKVPFFFKQWGGVQKKKAGRELRGKIYGAWPSVLDRMQAATPLGL